MNIKEKEKLFVIEDRMMQCWNIVEDLETLEYVSESEDLIPMIEGLKKLYQAKFERLQVAVEDVLRPYEADVTSAADHPAFGSKGLFDTLSMDYPDDGAFDDTDDSLTINFTDEPVKVTYYE